MAPAVAVRITARRAQGAQEVVVVMVATYPALWLLREERAMAARVLRYRHLAVVVVAAVTPTQLR